jgi:hypothetical protein
MQPTLPQATVIMLKSCRVPAVNSSHRFIQRSTAGIESLLTSISTIAVSSLLNLQYRDRLRPHAMLLPCELGGRCRQLAAGIHDLRRLP